MNGESLSIITGDKVDYGNKTEIHLLQERVKWDKIAEYFSYLYKEASNPLLETEKLK